jgi:hypothetical protein
MKTWKIVGITGLMLVNLFWSGAAQAKRNHNQNLTNSQNQATCQPYGYHHEPRWVAERERERLHHERERHHNWERYHNRMARSSHWW